MDVDTKFSRHMRSLISHSSSDALETIRDRDPIGLSRAERPLSAFQQQQTGGPDRPIGLATADRGL